MTEATVDRAADGDALGNGVESFTEVVGYCVDDPAAMSLEVTSVLEDKKDGKTVVVVEEDISPVSN